MFQMQILDLLTNQLHSKRSTVESFKDAERGREKGKEKGKKETEGKQKKGLPYLS